jgi:hypothetical protein
MVRHGGIRAAASKKMRRDFKIQSHKEKKMAKKRFFFGTLATVLVLGLVFAGCTTTTNSNGKLDNNPRTIKITGFNLEGIRPLVMHLKPESEGLFSDPVVAADPEIDGTTLSYKLAEYGPEWERASPNGPRDDKPWTGTGKFVLGIILSPSPNDPSKNASFYFYSAVDTLEDGTNPATAVDIKDTVTTLEWSKFYCAWDDNI